MTEFDHFLGTRPVSAQHGFDLNALSDWLLQKLPGFVGPLTVFVMFQVTAVQRSMGQSKLPLAVFAAGNVLNLLLAVLLVYGPGPAPAIFSWGPPIAAALGLPRWGVVGAAWATVIARAVVMVIPLLLLRRSLGVGAHRAPLLPSRPVLRRIVSLAWPTSTQFTVRIAAVLLVIALVHHFFTTPGNSDAGTAYALCLRMETMALFVSMGWGGAAQTLVGTNVGAGLYDRARRAAWITGAYNVASMLILAVLFIGGGEHFLRFFTTQDAIVRRAQDYLAWVGPSYTAFGFAIVLGNALVGAGSTRLALRIDLVLVLAVQFPLMLIVTAGLHAPPSGLWATVVAVNVVGALVYSFVARRGSSWRSAIA
jgi:putative MATE family efflux protein